MLKIMLIDKEVKRQFELKFQIDSTWDLVDCIFENYCPQCEISEPIDDPKKYYFHISNIELNEIDLTDDIAIYLEESDEFWTWIRDFLNNA